MESHQHIETQAVQHAHQRVLLLQGMPGPFFKRFARDLEVSGHTVYKINFNAGDALFYRGERVTAYRDTLKAWPDFLKRYLIKYKIDRIYVYADRHNYHAPAKQLARSLGVRFFAFEAGYVKPKLITLDEGGINGDSTAPKDPDVYRAWALKSIDLSVNFPKPTYKMALYTVLHGAAAKVSMLTTYRHYKHFRKLTLSVWANALWRKWRNGKKDQILADRLIQSSDQKIFLLTLQGLNCKQKRIYSPYPSNRVFIKEVMASFSRFADPDQVLIIKNHPYERGRACFRRLVKRLGNRYGCASRVFYLCDAKIDPLMQASRGVITLNSATGLQALAAGIPVKALGKPIYDVKGLTHQSHLEDFWRCPEVVDSELFKHFHNWLIWHTQANGCFFVRPKNAHNASGITWLNPDASLQSTGSLLESSVSPVISSSKPSPETQKVEVA